MTDTIFQPNNPSPVINVEIKDFIGKFTGAFTPEFCNDVIQWYKIMDSKGFGFNRQEVDHNIPAHLKDTNAVFTTNSLAVNGVPAIHKHMTDVIWKYYDIYRGKYSALQTGEGTQGIYELKVQETQIGGGFHVWHWEQAGRSVCNRLMNVQIFLNTVEAGGETEFLYLNRIEPAVQGTLLIYPGNYTHTHRGNPPRSGVKYLSNCWIEL